MQKEVNAIQKYGSLFKIDVEVSNFTVIGKKIQLAYSICFKIIGLKLFKLYLEVNTIEEKSING